MALVLYLVRYSFSAFPQTHTLENFSTGLYGSLWGNKSLEKKPQFLIIPTLVHLFRLSLWLSNIKILKTGPFC